LKGAALVDRVDVIDGWMQRILDTGGIERLDDLHVDTISPEWKEHETWVDGSSEAIKLARKSRSRIAPDKVLALMCSLTSESSETPPASIEDLATQIDWSPPSLYLFEPYSEPWSVSSGVTVTRLNELFSGCTCLLLEFAAAGEPTPRRSFVAIV
jgi:hypothetical protein